MDGKWYGLAVFDVGIDSKLCGCHLVTVKLDETDKKRCYFALLLFTSNIFSQIALSWEAKSK